MIFRTTPIGGVVVVEPERQEDARGFFARTFDAKVFGEHGLDPAVAQMSTSFNVHMGTLRGMHFQAAPAEEVKLVRCTHGSIFDVALDLREASPTRLRWHGVELSAENGLALFVPRGCGHGFQTLEPESEVLYVMSTPYVPGAGRGVRWDDPAFEIEWPDPPTGGRVMSDRDAGYGDFEV